MLVSLSEQNEIQSAHWCHSQVTLFTACAFTHMNVVLFQTCESAFKLQHNTTCYNTTQSTTLDFKAARLIMQKEAKRQRVSFHCNNNTYRTVAAPEVQVIIVFLLFLKYISLISLIIMVNFLLFGHSFVRRYCNSYNYVKVEFPFNTVPIRCMGEGGGAFRFTV